MATFELNSIELNGFFNSIECFISGAQSFAISSMHLIESNAHLYLSKRVESNFREFIIHFRSEFSLYGLLSFSKNDSYRIKL
jgi:hypothetical protein